MLSTDPSNNETNEISVTRHSSSASSTSATLTSAYLSNTHSTVVSPNSVSPTIVSNPINNSINSLCCSDHLKCVYICIGSILCTCFTIGLVLASITYIVFGIIALVNNKNTADDCKNSYLWYYVLVSIILFVLSKKGESQIILVKTGDNDDFNMTTYICSLFCYLLMQIGLAIWGYIELYNYSYNDYNTTYFAYDSQTPCADLSDSLLYTMGLITMIQQWCVAGLIGLSFIICFIYLCYNIRQIGH